jgi:hypothetical protein
MSGLSEMEKEKKPEFVVTDRRKFNVDGAPRPDAPVEVKAEPAPMPEVPAAKSVMVEPSPAVTKPETTKSALAPEPTSETGYNGDNERTEFGGQKMEFIHLLDMLVQTAMMYAGAMETGTERRVDIVGLRQMIDLISVLEQKTKGNLTEQEQAILTNTVFQLRMTYMETVNMIDKQALKSVPGAPGAPRK